jgi:endoglycosylceramidase
MNEPFPGSSGIHSTMILLKAFGELYYSIKGEVLSEEQLAQMWGDEASRLEALELISTKENYGFVFNQLNDLVAEFEKNQLQQMYQKVSSAIREVDQKHIIFLEHSYFGNTGVKSGISRVELADGTPDPQVAYAPHGYDLVTDTKSVGSASNERVTYIYDQIKSKGKELNMPVWLGEWGAFYSNAESVVPVAQNAVGLIEDYLFSNAYWSYQNNTAELDYFNEALLRTYPAYTNGTLISYKNDFDNKQYKMSWQEDENSKAASMIFIPKISSLSRESIQAIEGAELIQMENSEAGWLTIPVLKNNKKRELVLKYN